MGLTPSPPHSTQCEGTKHLISLRSLETVASYLIFILAAVNAVLI